MKNIITILSILVIFSSCSRSTNNTAEIPDVTAPKEFVGKWKLIEICESSGSGDCTWKDFDSGKLYDIEYRKDGTMFSNLAINNCANGTFYFSKDLFTLYNKLECQTSYESSKIVSLTSTEMVLDTHVYEPSYARYKKIETPN